MTTAQLVTRIQKYCGNVSLADATTVLEMANDRQNSMALQFFYDNLETINAAGIVTVAGTRTYSYPTNDYHIETMEITTTNYEGPLEEKDWDWMVANHDPLSQGKPYVWVIHEGRIYLEYIPDAVYTIRTAGKRLPTAMVSGGQAPSLPEPWHPALALMSAADVHFLIGNYTAAMTLKNEGLGWISSLPEYRTLRRLRTPGQINAKRIKPQG